MAGDFPSVTSGRPLYDVIRARLDQAGRLEEPDFMLPDEPKVMSGGVPWVAGAMDGVMSGGSRSAEAADKASRAVDAFARACDSASKSQLRALYDAVSDDSVLSFVDPTIERLYERQLDRSTLHELGRWLATTAPDRGPVKVGLAVMGATGLGSAVDVVRALGAHEEFTLYAAVALSNGLAEPESELWALATAVNGWGRIQCVERLRNTHDPAIRSWILRHGFRNSIMYEYLAYVAATTGGLLDALRADDVDRELLTAAGEILQALIQGGPAEDLDDYASGPDAVEAFLDHIDGRAETLKDFHAVAAIRSFLSAEDGWEARSQRGWTVSRREAFEARCDEILGRDEWAGRIEVGLLSDDEVEFWRADQAARMRGVDTFDLHVDKIRADPLGAGWFEAWNQADADRAELLVTMARELLPAGEIATGPDDELGTGARWRAHTALDWTLQALRRHVGVGGDLVLVGLQSPVTRNRNMALNVLKVWPKSAWPEGAARLAEDLAYADPNERTRRFAADVRGEAGNPSTPDA